MSSAAVGFLKGESPPGQIVLGIILVGIAYLVFASAEAVVKNGKKVASRFMNLLPYSAIASDGPVTIYQNPLLHPTDAKTVGLSENERTGIEFAYSFYMMVYPDTITGDDVLFHVFHKGYQCAWPLMGPAVFMRGNSNTMRIVMNSYTNPYNYVDVPNIPMKKWIHVVLNSHKNSLEVHLNGNIINRITFDESLPYQNFGDIFVFNNANYIVNLVDQPKFQVQGCMSGYLSNLTYARYALSYNEIQALLNAGPSKNILQTANKDRSNLPPYLADDWWTGGV
jgi:hypothetical protein